MKAATRNLPLSVQFFQLFGSLPAQLGWFFLLLSSFVFWPLIAHPLYDNMLLSGPLQETSGVVLSHTHTGLEMDGKAVIAHRIRYRIGSQEYETEAYLNGESKEPDTQVKVSYPAHHPELAKVAGMRRLAVPNSAFVLFLLLSAVASLMAGARFYRGWQDLKLLRRGLFAPGQRVRAQEGEFEKFYWRYHYQGQEYTLSTSKGEAEQGLICFLASDPHQALCLESLPGQLQASESGEIRSAVANLSPLIPILPCWALASHVWFLTQLLRGF